MLDALLTEYVGEHERPPQADGLDAQGQQLDGVGAVAHAAVGQDLDAVEEAAVLAVDLEGDLERRGRVVDLAAAVIGKNDGGDLVPDGQLDVFDGLDALEDDGEVRQLGEALVPVPLDGVSFSIC